MKDSGELLVSHFKANVPHGPFTKIGKNGCKEEGVYNQGEIEGEVRFTYARGGKQVLDIN